MCWTVETNSGCFQGDSVEEVVHDMADFYCDDPDNSIPQITDLYWMNEAGMCCQANDNAINWFEGECEDRLSEYKQEVADEREHQRQLRSDYYASVL